MKVLSTKARGLSSMYRVCVSGEGTHVVADDFDAVEAVVVAVLKSDVDAFVFVVLAAADLDDRG